MGLLVPAGIDLSQSLASWKQGQCFFVPSLAQMELGRNGAGTVQSDHPRKMRLEPHPFLPPVCDFFSWVADGNSRNPGVLSAVLCHNRALKEIRNVFLHLVVLKASLSSPSALTAGYQRRGCCLAEISWNQRIIKVGKAL